MTLFNMWTHISFKSISDKFIISFYYYSPCIEKSKLFEWEVKTLLLDDDIDPVDVTAQFRTAFRMDVELQVVVFERVDLAAVHSVNC